MEEYPIIDASNVKGFINLFKDKDEKELVKNDIKTLLMQYFHQVNHDKIGKKLRKCLIGGIIIFIFVVSLSIILLLCQTFPFSYLAS